MTKIRTGASSAGWPVASSGSQRSKKRELLLEVALHAPDALRRRSRRRGRTSRRRACRRGSRGRRRAAAASAVLLGHRREVLGVGGRERVVPAGRDRHRDVGVLVPVARVVVLDPRPVLVVGAAGVVVEQRVLERRHVAQRGLAALPRRRAEELPQVAEVVPDVLLLGRVVGDVLRVLGVDEERPEHVLLHRAALAALVLEAVRRHDVGPDRGQVRRALERRAHLRDRRVRAADRADPPVRPRLRRDPLADVVAVRARCAASRRGSRRPTPSER